MILSIVIPAYNVEKYISHCLDSILAQDIEKSSYEIIIINDGSSDGTLKVILSYAQKNPHIKVIDRENAGVGSARNEGIEQATGTYIYFIDPDDFLTFNCLNRFIQFCEEHDLEVLTFLSERLTSASEALNKPLKNLSLLDLDLTPIVSGEDYLANSYYRNEVWWYIIKRDIVQNLGLKFDEAHYLEDANFTLTLFLNVQRMAHINAPVHKYRVTPGSIMNSKNPQHYQSLIKDIQYAALAFKPLISQMEKKTQNSTSLNRIKGRQESLVFFSMIRMLKSKMTLGEVKQQMNLLRNEEIYPLKVFPNHEGGNRKKFYKTLVDLFNVEDRFYRIFILCNPILRRLN